MPIANIVLFGFLAATATILPAYAQSGESSRPERECFSVDQFQGWRAPDTSTIYIRVTSDRYYRLDLAGQCQKLKWPGSHLITNFHGKSTICSPLDWDLSVAEQNGGAPEQCIVHSMTKLTPSQVMDIPRPFKP